ncbi:MAG: N-formylglutamate amidohydrolase [Bacteroidales bacterium]|nr:N-formylglutamate amidohydrolase [Bacteroidales bacterium]
MMELSQYSLKEIEARLLKGRLPFSGITELGSSEFHFKEPAFFAGVSMHSGHRVRREILEFLTVDAENRYREEDPFMDRFISDFPLRIYGRDSRFEYDLNRNPYKAIYDFDKPKWGLKVWNREIPEKERVESIKKHREFHGLLELVCKYLLQQHRYALLFDLHAYCYQREIKQEWYEDERPEINIGTRAVNREIFDPAINCFIKNLYKTRIDGHPMRISENEIFLGGYLSRHLSRIYHDQLLVLSLEYKKIFMDEWTGKLYQSVLDKLVRDFTRAVDRTVETCLFAL